MQLICYVLLIVQYLLPVIHATWVIDVDSSIIDEINQNPSIGYLIKFHAPWCGHCRKFEPIYEEIAKEVQELSTTDDEFKNIRIVRVDATVHSSVANYYDIRGYPTIKFIRGSQILSYENERTKAAVLNFLKRVNGPSIRWISSIEKFEDTHHEHDVFFLLLTTSNDDEDPLTKEYTNIVNRYLSQAYFYATNSSIIQEKYFPNYSSGVFAIKIDGIFIYKSENSSLEEFILQEKVTTFPQVAAGNIYDLILTKKIIIIYGFNENKNELKSQIYNYVIQHSSNLHEQFQFAWSNDLELLNNIAVWTLEHPLIFLYDSNQRKYGIYPLSTAINQNISIESILDEIVSNYSEIIQHTGNTWKKRLLRPFWEFYRTITAMFIEAPLLSMLIIGLPSSILSIVCYCLCCLPNETLMDENEIPVIVNDNDDEEEEGDDGDDDDAQKKTTIEKKR